MVAEAEATVELLLEVRTEDMPPRLAPGLVRRLGIRLFEVLMGASLAPAEITTGSTRRRLLVHCRGLPAQQPPRTVRELGPPAAEAWDKDRTPTAAAEAFATQHQAESSELVEARLPQGVFAAIERAEPGRTAAAVLAESLPGLLAEVPREQRMVWGDGRGPWLRPIRSIVALVGGEIVPFAFCGVESSRTTAGHPILSPERFEVADGDDYLAKLAARGIEVRVDERRARLAAELEQRVSALGGTVDDAARVVARMARDCEIPGLVDGAIAPEHLALPEEIVTSALAERPGAVVLRDTRGALLPRFVTVVDRPDDPRGLVRAGYERTVFGRLADAAFLRAVDRRHSLADHAAHLAELECPYGGTWGEHGGRIGALAAAVLEQQDRGALVPAAEAAAALLHADRSSALVAELALPRGMVGGLHARDDGHEETVWQAIFDHRLPRAAEGPLPRGEVGTAVALADRLLALAAGVGDDADGPGIDPLRGRRLAEGAVRLLIEGRIEVDLDLLVGRAVRLLGGHAAQPHDELTRAVADLLRDRARRLLGRRGFAADEVAAASAVRGGSLAALLARAEALRAHRGDPSLRELVRIARRIERVVADSDPGPLEAGLTEPAERALADALETARAAADPAVAGQRYGDVLDAFAPLADAVDRLFDEVLVMAEDPERRGVRLALLQAVRRLLGRVGRLSALELSPAEAAEADAETTP